MQPKIDGHATALPGVERGLHTASSGLYLSLLQYFKFLRNVSEKEYGILIHILLLVFFLIGYLNFSN